MPLENNLPSQGAAAASASLPLVLCTEDQRLPVAVAPTMGTSVYLAVSGTSAAFSADFAIGKHILRCDVAVSYRINATATTTAAVWQTSPAILLPAGVTEVITCTAARRITAITAGGTGVLMGLPIS